MLAQLGKLEEQRAMGQNVPKDADNRIKNDFNQRYLKAENSFMKQHASPEVYKAYQEKIQQNK